MSYLRVGNNNDFVVSGLCLASDRTFINDAELEFTLYNASFEVVAGAEDIPMPYEADSNGCYRGTMDATAVTLTAKARYRVDVVDVNFYTGTLKWRKWFVANERA